MRACVTGSKTLDWASPCATEVQNGSVALCAAGCGVGADIGADAGAGLAAGAGARSLRAARLRVEKFSRSSKSVAVQPASKSAAQQRAARREDIAKTRFGQGSV